MHTSPYRSYPSGFFYFLLDFLFVVRNNVVTLQCLSDGGCYRDILPSVLKMGGVHLFFYICAFGMRLFS